MELLKKHCFLVIRKNDESCNNRHRISIASGLYSVFGSWATSTRISPIFPLQIRQSFSPTDELFDGLHHLIILGPTGIHSLESELHNAKNVWLTLGLYNILVDIDASKLDDWIQTIYKLELSGEVWVIKDGEIKECQYILSPYNKMAWREKISTFVLQKAPMDLSDVIGEFGLLMAANLSRAESYAPYLVKCLENMYEEVEKTLDDYHKTLPIYLSIAHLDVYFILMQHYLDFIPRHSLALCQFQRIHVIFGHTLFWV